MRAYRGLVASADGGVSACPTTMYGLFKFVMYLGVLAGLAGFLWPRFADHPAIVEAALPIETPQYLSFGGLGLVILGLIGRSATRPEPTAEWK